MNFNRISMVFLSIAAFLSFVFFSYLVHKNIFVQFDFDITVKLQDNLPRRVDEYFSMLSEFGNFEFMLVFLVILLVVFRKFIGGLFILFFFAAFHIIEIFGKTYVMQLPPPEFMLRIKKILEFPQFHVRNEFSYPSGHAGRTAFLSIVLAGFILSSKRIPKNIKPVLILGILIFDFLMFVSRPYLGEHWTTDVIGGALLGFSLGILSLVFVIKNKKGSVV